MQQIKDESEGFNTDSSYSTTIALGNTKFTVFCDMTFLSSQFMNIHSQKRSEDKLFHNHFFNEIIIIESGEVLFELEDNRFVLSAGQVAYVPKNKLHFFRFQPDCRYRSMGFTFKETAMKNKHFNSYEKFSRTFSDEPIVLPRAKIFTDLTDSMKKYIREPYTFSYLMIGSLIEQFILTFYEFSATDDKEEDRTPFFADFNFIINQRINNIQDKTKLRDIADELFISERHLSRIIKKQYGVSFMERKQQLKIESAKQLLKNSDLSIEKISEKVAFYDTGTFIKQFTKRVGISPTQYRENNIAKLKKESESNS